MMQEAGKRDRKRTGATAAGGVVGGTVPMPVLTLKIHFVSLPPRYLLLFLVFALKLAWSEMAGFHLGRLTQWKREEGTPSSAICFNPSTVYLSCYPVASVYSTLGPLDRWMRHILLQKKALLRLCCTP